MLRYASKRSFRFLTLDQTWARRVARVSSAAPPHRLLARIAPVAPHCARGALEAPRRSLPSHAWLH